MQHYTTIEQSKKLVELGLNPNTADMFWQSNLNSSDRQYLLNMGEEEYFDIELNSEHFSIEDYDIPAWSLGALLDVMPDGVQINFNHTGVIIDITFVHNGIITNSHHIKNNTLLEAAYSMVVWLLENRYIEKEK